MADALTTTSSLSSDTTAYEQAAIFALRPQLYFDKVATRKPTNQSHVGAAVQFNLYDDLSVASTAINQSVDVDAVAMADSTATVTLVEQGNAVLTTAKMRGTSFLQVDMDAANLVGFNAGVSLDTIARDVLKAGSNVRYSNGGTAPVSRATVESNDTIQLADARRFRTDLVGANVDPVGGGEFYVGFMHPDVAFDFTGLTGTAGWRDPHAYNGDGGGGSIWTGEIGAWNGVRWIETPRAPVYADAGSSTTLTDVYATIVVGADCLAKAWSSTVSAPLPQVVLGEVVDKLRRFRPVGWYWLGGYSIFRQAAIRRCESASSIGTNS